MFHRLQITIREFLIVYVKVIILLKWKNLYKRLLQKINRLNHLKLRNVSQVVCSYLNYCFIAVNRTMSCGCWLYIQSTESRNILLVGSVMHSVMHYNQSMK